MSSRPSQRLLLSRLAAGEVDFVLVGGLAVAAHGFVRATEDVDLVYSTTPASCDRFASVLAELGAEVTFADAPEPDGGITAEWLAAGGRDRDEIDLAELRRINEPGP